MVYGLGPPLKLTGKATLGPQHNYRAVRGVGGVETCLHLGRCLRTITAGRVGVVFEGGWRRRFVQSRYGRVGVGGVGFDASYNHGTDVGNLYVGP